MILGHEIEQTDGKKSTSATEHSETTLLSPIDRETIHLSSKSESNNLELQAEGHAETAGMMNVDPTPLEVTEPLTKSPDTKHTDSDEDEEDDEPTNLPPPSPQASDATGLDKMDLGSAPAAHRSRRHRRRKGKRKTDSASYGVDEASPKTLQAKTKSAKQFAVTKDTLQVVDEQPEFHYVTSPSPEPEVIAMKLKEQPSQDMKLTETGTDGQPDKIPQASKEPGAANTERKGPTEDAMEVESHDTKDVWFPPKETHEVEPELANTKEIKPLPQEVEPSPEEAKEVELTPEETKEVEPPAEETMEIEPPAEEIKLPRAKENEDAKVCEYSTDEVTQNTSGIGLLDVQIANAFLKDQPPDGALSPISIEIASEGSEAELRDIVQSPLSPGDIISEETLDISTVEEEITVFLDEDGNEVTGETIVRTRTRSRSRSTTPVTPDCHDSTRLLHEPDSPLVLIPSFDRSRASSEPRTIDEQTYTVVTEEEVEIVTICDAGRTFVSQTPLYEEVTYVFKPTVEQHVVAHTTTTDAVDEAGDQKISTLDSVPFTVETVVPHTFVLTPVEEDFSATPTPTATPPTSTTPTPSAPAQQHAPTTELSPLTPSTTESVPVAVTLEVASKDEPVQPPLEFLRGVDTEYEASKEEPTRTESVSSKEDFEIVSDQDSWNISETGIHKKEKPEAQSIGEDTENDFVFVENFDAKDSDDAESHKTVDIDDEKVGMQAESSTDVVAFDAGKKESDENTESVHTSVDHTELTLKSPDRATIVLKLLMPVDNKDDAADGKITTESDEFDRRGTIGDEKPLAEDGKVEKIVAETDYMHSVAKEVPAAEGGAEEAEEPLRLESSVKEETPPPQSVENVVIGGECGAEEVCVVDKVEISKDEEQEGVLTEILEVLDITAQAGEEELEVVEEANESDIEVAEEAFETEEDEGARSHAADGGDEEVAIENDDFPVEDVCETPSDTVQSLADRTTVIDDVTLQWEDTSMRGNAASEDDFVERVLLLKEPGMVNWDDSEKVMESSVEKEMDSSTKIDNADKLEGKESKSCMPESNASLVEIRTEHHEGSPNAFEERILVLKDRNSQPKEAEDGTDHRKSSWVTTVSQNGKTEESAIVSTPSAESEMGEAVQQLKGKDIPGMELEKKIRTSQELSEDETADISVPREQLHGGEMLPQMMTDKVMSGAEYSQKTLSSQDVTGDEAIGVVSPTEQLEKGEKHPTEQLEGGGMLTEAGAYKIVPGGELSQKLLLSQDAAGDETVDISVPTHQLESGEMSEKDLPKAELSPKILSSQDAVGDQTIDISFPVEQLEGGEMLPQAVADEDLPGAKLSQKILLSQEAAGDETTDVSVPAEQLEGREMIPQTTKENTGEEAAGDTTIDVSVPSEQLEIGEMLSQTVADKDIPGTVFSQHILSSQDAAADKTVDVSVAMLQLESGEVLSQTVADEGSPVVELLQETLSSQDAASDVTGTVNLVSEKVEGNEGKVQVAVKKGKETEEPSKTHEQSGPPDDQIKPEQGIDQLVGEQDLDTVTARQEQDIDLGALAADADQPINFTQGHDHEVKVISRLPKEGDLPEVICYAIIENAARLLVAVLVCMLL